MIALSRARLQVRPALAVVGLVAMPIVCQWLWGAGGIGLMVSTAALVAFESLAIFSADSQRWSLVAGRAAGVLGLAAMIATGLLAGFAAAESATPGFGTPGLAARAGWSAGIQLVGLGLLVFGTARAAQAVATGQEMRLSWGLTAVGTTVGAVAFFTVWYP